MNLVHRVYFAFSMILLASLFAVFVLSNDDHNVRSERACSPIVWVANLSYSTITLFDNKEDSHFFIKKNFEPLYTSCLSSSYDLFYGPTMKQHLLKLIR